MTTNKRLNYQKAVFIFVLVLGIIFRFVNLDKKYYWADESYTSLRISGYTERELIQEFSNKKNVISVQQLQKYRYPNSEKSLSDTVNSLALEDPQHPPLYFLLTRLWVQWFGNSVAVTRSLSALVSLLIFPCIYWLCQELFASPLVGWMALALVAISPFHVLYAQEARPYSLWTVTILLSSAALLRAIRLKTKLSWGMYAIASLLGLWTTVLSGVVLIAHGVYVFITEKFRFSKTLTAYLAAALTSLLAFTPWLFVIISSLNKIQHTTETLSRKTDLFTLVKRWVAGLSVVFLDTGLEPNVPIGRVLPLIPFIALILILVGYSLVFLYRHAPPKSYVFIFTLIGVTFLTLALADLLLSGKRSGTPRLLIPSYLGIQLAVAYLLATFINAKIKRQKLWQLMTSGVILAGVFSCAIASQAPTWWNKAPGDDRYVPQVAQIVNQATNPLLVSDDFIQRIIPLTYRLNPQVKLLVHPICYTSCSANSFSSATTDISKSPEGFSQVFLFRSPKIWPAQFERDYTVELFHRDGELWKLEKKTM
jgi:uncharacterized membrane protein